MDDVADGMLLEAGGISASSLECAAPGSALARVLERRLSVAGHSSSSFNNYII